MIALDAAALAALTPGASLVYRQAFERLADLEPFGVLSSRFRAEHFIAQCLQETGGLRLLVENLSYSAKRLTEVWPNRFRFESEAQPFAGNPRALANKIYGGRMGNVGADDGWRYIGRGLLQITGRANYDAVGQVLGLDLVGYPTLVLAPEHTLKVAGEVWWMSQCNIFADADSLERVTKAINGGLIGLDERRAWLQKVRDHHVVN